MHKELFEWLESEGWRPGQDGHLDDCDRIWYRQYPDVKPNCRCNLGKRGLQVVLKMYDLSRFGHAMGSFQVEVRAEPDDGEWVILEVYGLRASELKDKLDAQVAKLLRAWVAVQSPVEQKA